VDCAREMVPLYWVLSRIDARLSEPTFRERDVVPRYSVFDAQGVALTRQRFRTLWHACERARCRGELAALELQGAPSVQIAVEDVLDAASGVHVRHPQLFTPRTRETQLKAQLQLLAVRWNLKQWGYATTANCAACAHRVETTRHVLNACEARLPLYTARHDAALKVLQKELGKLKLDMQELRIDQTSDPTAHGSNYRPDVIAKLKRGRGSEYVIADLKCPFPVPGFVHDRDTANLQKYEALRADHEQATGKASLFTLVIPTLGPVPSMAADPLLALGVPRNQCAKILRSMAAAVVRGNARLRCTLHKDWDGTLKRANDPQDA